MCVKECDSLKETPNHPSKISFLGLNSGASEELVGYAITLLMMKLKLPSLLMKL